MCRTEKQLLFPVSKNRKVLRQLEAKLLVFLPSFLLHPSHEGLITFLLECVPFISQAKQWNLLIGKVVNFAPPPFRKAVPQPACLGQHSAAPDQTCKPWATLSTTHAKPDRQPANQPVIHRSGSQAVQSDTVCRAPDKQAEPPDTTIIAAPPDNITAENTDPSGTQRTEKRKKGLRSWLLTAQRREILKESKYLSGFHPMKHTGNKAEILPTCLQHPSNYVTDRLKCKQCTRELDLHIDMLKDADSYKEQQQIKEDKMGFRGVQVHTTMIKQQIKYHKRLEEYVNIYGEISPHDQHIFADHARECEQLFTDVHETDIPFLSKKIQEGSIHSKLGSFLYEVLLADVTGTGQVSLMIQLDRICKSNFSEAAANCTGTG